MAEEIGPGSLNFTYTWKLGRGLHLCDTTACHFVTCDGAELPCPSSVRWRPQPGLLGLPPSLPAAVSRPLPGLLWLELSPESARPCVPFSWSRTGTLAQQRLLLSPALRRTLCPEPAMARVPMPVKSGGWRG